MTIAIRIGRRKAIPIRAIPFVAGWSADLVAAAFAHTDPAQRLKDRGLFAYHMQFAHPTRMLPNDWRRIEAELRALSQRLMTDGKATSESYAVWQRESISLLPPAAFVWQTEFAYAIANITPIEHLGIPDFPEHHLMHTLEDGTLPENPPPKNATKARAKLNLTPWIPPELHEVVFGGFAVPHKHNKATSDVLAGQYLTPLLAIQHAAIAEFFAPRRNPDAKSEEVVEWIKAAMANAKLPVSDNVARAIFTIIRPPNHNPKKRRE